MDAAPMEGSWYKTDIGEVFMVVKANAANGLIDVPYVDDGVDQFDHEIWSGLNVTQVDPLTNRVLAWTRYSMNAGARKSEPVSVYPCPQICNMPITLVGLIIELLMLRRNDLPPT